ncbi:MFS transporter [Actinomyces vulturis]|uniref:MFS transporter n=1 Tax=Actinomyces vulturis TaxID=1857645 RepID=UPI001146C140|nr:MFS transporter [Actinomyces vulturis]
MSASPLLSLGVSTPITLVCVVVFVSAFGITAAGVTYDSTLQRRVPRSELSRVASIDDLLSFAPVPLSQVLIGPVSGYVGEHELFIVCPVAIIVLRFAPLLVRDV